MNKMRCSWCSNNSLLMEYHDKEWGVPLHDDQKLFEFLILEGAQAGLSWLTILKRREDYRVAFDNFDAEKIARFTPQKIEHLLQNTQIIRNRLKVNSVVQNAQAFIAVQEKWNSFNDYIWRFVDEKPKINHWTEVTHIPATSKESDSMAKDLKKIGFSFVGSTICYAFMQAIGMVNDHIIHCFRHDEVLEHA